MMAITPSTPEVRIGLNQSPQLPLSEEEISDKVRSINALEIDLIGMKIIEKVLNNLGPENNARVTEQLMQQVKETGGASQAMMRHDSACAGVEVESGKTQFLSDEETSSFINVALYPIKDELGASFSAYFSVCGMFFKVCEYEPMGFLAKTAKEMGINITLSDVPSKYFIFLKLDKELTREASDLVFVLTEVSHEVEFSKETFTLSELKDEFETQVREAFKTSSTTHS